MDSVNGHIWRKFRVKSRDTLPLTTWLESNRTHLAELFFELGYKLGAEVGVNMGCNSEVLLKCNPNLTLMCVDSWAPYSRTSQYRQDRILRHCSRRLRQFGERAIIKKAPSMEAVKEVKDGSLDFVYIDALHDFDSVMMDIIEWSKKVRPGGIVSGHDYFNYYQFGVIQAVNAYTYAHNITCWYVTRDEAPSWFWVKT